MGAFRLSQDIYLSGAVRTPIGKYGGSLRDLSAAELGEHAARASLLRSGIGPDRVDEVIFGNARQAGGGPNVARQIGHRAEVPVRVPAYTVNKACGSGLKSLALGAQSILLGESRVVLAGGTESMSGLPYLLPKARWGYRLGNDRVVDAMYQDGFLDPLCGLLMGETAEILAEEYGISREEQDRFALESQARCERARAEGWFEAEIAPIEVEGRKGAHTLKMDEHPRDGVTLESLAKLPTVFSKEGSVTPGNACGITDGAAACLVLSADAARELDVEPQVRLVGVSSAGVEPRTMGIGPVPALRALAEATGVPLDRVDLVELNEAFAVQVLACARDLPELDLERVNVNGGAIALGHPIGCTGTRIAVTLIHEMQRRRVRYGIATLCISGGLGMAALFERMSA